MDHKRKVVLIAFLTGLFFVSTQGQIPGGMNEVTATRLGGNNFVVGTVFWPNGNPINVRMRIKLVTFQAGDFITTTDDRGQFIFSGVPPGSYTVVIDREDEFEAVNQPVDISADRNPKQIFTITIRLMSRKTTTKAAVVSASRLAAPKKAADLFDEATELSRSGDKKGAIEKLKKAIAEYPAFTDAYNELAVQYMALNQLNEAQAALSEALKIENRAFEPTLNLGITLFRLKKYDEAEARLRDAIAIKPGTAYAHFYLGRTLTALAKFPDSEKSLNTALELSKGELKEAHRMLAQLFIESGEYKRAVDELELYLKLVPEPPDRAELRKALAQLKAASTQKPDK